MKEVTDEKHKYCLLLLIRNGKRIDQFFTTRTCLSAFKARVWAEKVERDQSKYGNIESSVLFKSLDPVEIEHNEE